MRGGQNLDPLFTETGKVSEQAFVKVILECLHSRSQILSSLQAQQEIEQVFHRVASFFLTFVIFLIFLLALGVSTNTIILSGAAALSAGGVVTSFVYTDFILSIILIVFLNPYSIGDGVIIEDNFMVVKKITTYFTEFVNLDGRIVSCVHLLLVHFFRLRSITHTNN